MRPNARALVGTWVWGSELRIAGGLDAKGFRVEGFAVAEGAKRGLRVLESGNVREV